MALSYILHIVPIPMNIQISLTILGMILGIAATGLVTALSMSEMQIQPAYSQAEHCSFTQAGSSSCVTLGQDRSTARCNPFGGCITNDDPSGKEVGTSIGSGHHSCGQFPNSVTCTVTPP